eukprot:scaffold3511_cov57-Attheya_sp.AAC.1
MMTLLRVAHPHPLSERTTPINEPARMPVERRHENKSVAPWSNTTPRILIHSNHVVLATNGSRKLPNPIHISSVISKSAPVKIWSIQHGVLVSGDSLDSHAILTWTFHWRLSNFPMTLAGHCLAGYATGTRLEERRLIQEWTVKV